MINNSLETSNDINGLTWQKWILLLILSAFHLFLAYINITSPRDFFDSTPLWIPVKHEHIYFVAACKIVGALGLLFPFTRRRAAWFFMVYYYIDFSLFFAGYLTHSPMITEIIEYIACEILIG